MARHYHPAFETVPVGAPAAEGSLVLEGLVRKLADDSLLMTWTGNGPTEPHLDNVTKYSRSFDHGKTWSEEKILFAHPHKGVFTPAVFVDGGTVYAFFNSYYTDTAFHQDTQSYISVSRDCAETFSLPRSFPGCINQVHIKCTLKIGNRWVFACSWRELTGPHWASFAHANKPCVIAGRVMEEPESSLYTSHTEYCGALLSDDAGQTFRLCGRLGKEGRTFVEPMMIPLSDGTLVMLIRTAEEPRLYESRSYDNGEHWTEAVPTDIPSAITKVLLLKDSAGKIYLVHNPTIDYRRNPLELWISDDDLKSFRKKIVLARDDDNFALCYPDGFVDEARGRLCLSWDDRRRIYYSEFPLDD